MAPPGRRDELARVGHGREVRHAGGRIEHQEEMDEGIQAWANSLGKYEIMHRCQLAGVHSMPVQDARDRVDNDLQMRHRMMYREIEHPALGSGRCRTRRSTCRRRRLTTTGLAR